MPTQRITTAADAAAILRRGGLVAFPTETVFGLGVDATNPAAVERLFQAKGRPSDNPLIVHVAGVEDWPLAAAALPDSAAKLMAAYSPGPLTVVLPRRAEIAPRVSAGLDTVGLRVPRHPFAQEMLRLAGVPIAAPSANRSGRPSCTTWRSVLEDLDGRIDAVVCRDADGCGIESTVVDCTTEPPTLLRPGAVTLEDLRRIAPGTRPAGDVSPGAVRSPGLAHPHYQPRAKVVLVDAPPTAEELQGREAAYCGIGASDQAIAPSSPLSFVRHYADENEYAAGFYEFLREADRRGSPIIYVQLASENGIGAALRDRQRRAAGVQ